MVGLLIPFGVDRSSHAIIEPEDASRGRACNCLCPGCHAPLLSRHPKEHRIHFAHDSKHPEAKPEQECPFSSAVAIAMMAREICSELIDKNILLPALEYTHCFDCCGEYVDFIATKQKTLRISDAQKKIVFGDLTFDLELSFGNAKILVELFHKGKPKQRLHNKKAFLGEKRGVLAINCDSFDSGVFAENKQLRFSSAVRHFILTNGLRSWVFHPRHESMFASMISSHQCQPETERWDDFEGFDEPTEVLQSEPKPREYARPVSVKLPSFEPKGYRCAMCNNEWLKKVAGPPVCPHCNTHLYAVSV